MSGFRWVTDVEAYARSAPSIRRGVVPILVPDERERQQRWQSVLEWYGVRERGADAAGPGRTSTRPGDGKHFIFVVGDALAPIARVYGDAVGRRVAMLASLDELERARRDHSPRSVLVVGDRFCFGAGRLARLAALDVPWAVITGACPAAISFMLAKQLLTPPAAAAEHLAVDAIQRALWRSGERQALDPDTLAETLARGSWRSLVLFAHGEGGHLKLPRVVLCGVPGTRERLATPAGDDGACASDGVAGRCKRVWSPEIRVMPVRELRAVDLVFLTCSGFSVASEAYPSDVSIVLAAADGYARSVVTPNRPIELSPHLAELCHLAQREADAPAVTADRCNDAEQWRSGSRPFVRLGDPAAADTSPRRSSPLATVERAAGAALHGRVVEVTGAARCFARTPRGVLVRAGDRPSIVDRHADLDELRRWAVDTSARLLDAAALERSIRWMYRTQGLRDGAADLERLRRTRETIEEQLHMVVVGASHSRRDGLWSPPLAELAREARRHVREWDACLADLAHAALLEEGVTILFNPVGAHKQQAISACVRCGSTRWLEECVTFAARARMMAVCPICGAQELWQPGGLRVRGRGPAQVVAGATASVDVRLTRGRAGDDGAAELAIAGVDKGRGRIFHRRRASTDGRARFAIPFPADASQDLHTVHLLAVRSLELAYLRVRIPTVPSSRATPRHGDEA